MGSSDQVTLTLTKDEALVLFEFATRFTDTDELKLEHQSEEIALWNLCAALEKELVEPFKPEYVQILQKAREALLPDDSPESGG